MLFNRPMSSFARIFFIEISPIFLLFGLSILGLETIKFEPFNKVILYGILSVVHCFSSLTYVNSAYRYRLVCNMLNTDKIENKIKLLSEKLLTKFSQKKDDVELLRYYFLDAINQFIEGSYEMAYFSAYKIIRERTIVDPKEYVSDKRNGEPSSFSEIRSILMHSRVKDTKVSPKKIRGIKVKLPEYTVEIIQRASELIEKLASDEYGE